MFFNVGEKHLIAKYCYFAGSFVKDNEIKTFLKEIILSESDSKCKSKVYKCHQL